MHSESFGIRCRDNNHALVLPADCEVGQPAEAGRGLPNARSSRELPRAGSWRACHSGAASCLAP